jgi:heptosyltransferase-1
VKLLLIKTSSLGDLIHTLPALTDAARALPELRVDWVVEESFSEIPYWHPAVRWVIPIALRRWRRRPLRSLLGGEPKAFLDCLRRLRYDRVLDAQGLLLKSALIARLARGHRVGLDRSSAREPLSALAYQERIRVPRQQHAIERNRQLFAQALGYDCPDGEPDYGLRGPVPAGVEVAPRLVFLHGTTWPTKHWPEEYWCELARLASTAGYQVRLPWGDAREMARAERIAAAVPAGLVLPRLSLSEMAAELAAAAGVVGVDTGLCHLAAALEVPAVTLYGATRPELTGTRGPDQLHLLADFPCAPCLKRSCAFTGDTQVEPACFASLTPALVWRTLQPLLRT